MNVTFSFISKKQLNLIEITLALVQLDSQKIDFSTKSLKITIVPYVH